MIKQTQHWYFFYRTRGDFNVRLLLSCGVGVAATPSCYHDCHRSYCDHSETLFNKSLGISVKETARATGGQCEELILTETTTVGVWLADRTRAKEHLHQASPRRQKFIEHDADFWPKLLMLTFPRWEKRGRQQLSWFTLCANVCVCVSVCVSVSTIWRYLILIPTELLQSRGLLAEGWAWGKMSAASKTFVLFFLEPVKQDCVISGLHQHRQRQLLISQYFSQCFTHGTEGFPHSR